MKTNTIDIHDLLGGFLIQLQAVSDGAVKDDQWYNVNCFFMIDKDGNIDTSEVDVTEAVHNTGGEGDGTG